MVGRRSYSVSSCGGLIATSKRISLWTSSFSVTSLVRLRFPRAFGRLRIVMPTLGSSKDCLRLIGSGRTNISLCVVTTGRGFHKKILGTLSESVGRGEPPRRLVCVFLLVLFLVFAHRQCMTCLFLVPYSFGSSVVELSLVGEDFEDLGYRGSSVHHLYPAGSPCFLFIWTSS